MDEMPRGWPADVWCYWHGSGGMCSFSELSRATLCCEPDLGQSVSMHGLCCELILRSVNLHAWLTAVVGVVSHNKRATALCHNKI